MDFKLAVELTKEIRKVKGVLSIFFPGAAASKTLKDIDLVVFYSNKIDSAMKKLMS